MARFYFLAYVIFTSCLVAVQPTKYVLKGTMDHLTPAISGQPTTILWKHNGNKVVEFDGSEQQAYKPFDGRISLDWHTADLEISGLRYEDSGNYELEVEINNNLQASQYTLEVIDKVAKPTISCEINKSSSPDDSKTKATLLCSAEPRKPESLMKFEWKSPGMLHIGTKLPITLGDEQDEVQYSCSVSNPVSSETASFTTKECYKENNSVALIAGLCISILLLLLLGVVLGVFFCKRRQKACSAHDAEKQSSSEGTGRGATQREEQRPFLGDETLPSHQRLNHKNTGKGGVRKMVEDIEGGRFRNKNSSSDEEKENNKDEHKETASTPSSPMSGSLSKQDHLNIDLPESSNTEEENNQDRASLKSGESFHSASGGQNEPNPAKVSGQSSDDEKSENTKDEHKETASTPSSPMSGSLSKQDHLNIDLPESSNTEDENNQDRASLKSGESFDSASEAQNDPNPAKVSDQSSEDEQSGQKAVPGLDTSLVCSENNKGEQKETGSPPASLRSDSPSQQEPGPDPDIYRGAPDPELLKEAAEKEVQLPESSDTEEAKNQGQDGTPRGSPEEAPQTDLKPEGDLRAVHSVPAGQTDPGPADDGSDQSSKDKKSGQEPAPEQPGSEIKTGEAKEPQTPSSSEPSSSLDQGHHAHINKDDPGAEESNEPAETGLSQQNPSDSKEAQGGVTDPAVSGLDEVTAEEGGNSLPLGGASRLPSGGDTTTKDHESDPEENKDLDDDGTKIKRTTPSPAPLGADSPFNSDPDVNQSKEPAEEGAPSDQTDSGEKNEPGPADKDPSSMHPGYVKEEAEKIDKRSRDEQTLLRRDRESTKSDHPSPLSPSTPGAGAPFQPGPADESQSDEDAVPKPPEQGVEAGEVNEPLKEKSGSDSVIGDDQKQEKSPDVPVQKAPHITSDKQAAPKQQAATRMEEDKDNQETDNPEQSVAPTTTKVETSNTDNVPPNTANEGQSEEGEQTGPGSAESERLLDSRATETGQGEGEMR